MSDPNGEIIDATNVGEQQPLIRAPYEQSLSKAFDKLTSEIFVFLLAYLILLIGMNAVGPGIPPELQDLLYIIPLLGIIAYGWLRKRTVLKDPTSTGINISAIFASGTAYVAGIRGARNSQDIPQTLNIRAGIVGSEAQLIGVDYGESLPSSNMSANYLVSLYESLNSADQRKLIQLANDMINKHEKSDAG